MLLACCFLRCVHNVIVQPVCVMMSSIAVEPANWHTTCCDSVRPGKQRETPNSFLKKLHAGGTPRVARAGVLAKSIRRPSGWSQ